MTWSEALRAGATVVGVVERMPALSAYIELFARWNRRINLSAARTPDEIADHVIDCLALVPHVPRAARVIDVGSGGGLPGIVLAAARPDLQLTCVEPIHKKAAFLRQAARDLALAVNVMTQRVDEVAGDHDVAVSRATFDAATWLEVALRLVVPGGRILAMEGLEQVSLPPDTTRHPYVHRNRTRAILVRIPR